MGKDDEEKDKTNVFANISEQIVRTKLFSFDIEIVVASTIFAVDLLRSDDTSCDAILVIYFVFAMTGFNDFSTHS